MREMSREDEDVVGGGKREATLDSEIRGYRFLEQSLDVRWLESSIHLG